MLARARGLKGSEEARALYRDWAAQYDADVFDTLKVRGSDRIADLLAAHLPARDAAIVDLGCGTGQVAARLKAHGFGRIDGLDFSPEMLEVARGKALYRELIAADLNRPLAIADDRYDAAVSAGTFTSGHVGADALAEIGRIVRPGGLLAVTIADTVWHEARFEDALARLTASGRLSILSDTHEPIVAGAAPQARFLVCRL